MKILVLNYEYPPLGGGAGAVSEDLAEQFVRDGHGVDVLTMAYRGLPRREERNGVAITRVPAWRKRAETCETPEMASFVASAVPATIQRLRRGRYDVLHCHFAIPTGLVAYLATRVCRVPYVITLHGSDVPGYNPDRFRREHCFTKPLLRRILRRAAAITSPSQYLARLATAAIGPLAITHIPNGIDVRQFASRSKLRRILMSGRLLPRKGFQYVLRALSGVDGEYEVHVAGDGPMRAELEQLAKELSQRVVFHGWLDHGSPELAALYESSSIFCLPSERENASISLLEAMLAGMAVVTSDVAGCPETVGDAAILVSPKDEEGMRVALARLLASEETVLDYGRRARARVLESFDRERIAARYLEKLQQAAEAS